tara:strand:+ start:566 stop:775 length:210 start_codon:yes stop_codon:yes gene_type:complete
LAPPAPTIKLQFVLIIPLKQLSAELTKQPAVALTIPVEQTTAALTQVGAHKVAASILAQWQRQAPYRTI